MSEIVKKLDEAPATVPHAGGSPGTREIRTHVVAETVGRQRKRAEVWGETAIGARRNSRWEINCDEGEAMGGEDTAPTPLAYFSAAIAF